MSEEKKSNAGFEKCPSSSKLERKKISRTDTFVVLKFYNGFAKIHVRKIFQNCSSVKISVHKTLKNQRKSSWPSF